jgi:hypothetical protein
VVIPKDYYFSILVDVFIELVVFGTLEELLVLVGGF